MPAPTPPASAPEGKGERFSLLSVSFGAVTGAILSILLRPLVERLPGPLFEEFLNTAVEDALSIGILALCTIAAARIRRLDHFLRRFLMPAALAASVLFALSLWLRAGAPSGLWPLACVAASGIECWLLLLFCGGAMRSGLMQIAGTQEAEYEKEREDEASGIAASAIAEGDPQLAAGAFGLNVAGEAGAAMGRSLVALLLVVFHLIAIPTVTAADAHFLFGLSLGWSCAAGVIILLAAGFAAIKSQEFGERYSDRVPLRSKYRGILPAREEDGKND